MCRKRRKKASSHFQRHFFTKDSSSKSERANKRANAFLRFGMSRKAQDMSKKKVAYSSRTGDRHNLQT